MTGDLIHIVACGVGRWIALPILWNDSCRDRGFAIISTSSDAIAATIGRVLAAYPELAHRAVRGTSDSMAAVSGGALAVRTLGSVGAEV